MATYDTWGGSWADSWGESWTVTDAVSDTFPHGPSVPEKRKRKSRVIRLSDFAARDEREAALRDAVKQTGLVLAKGKPLPVAVSVEPPAFVPDTRAETAAIQQADAQLAVSAQVLADMQRLADDEAAMMMLLLAHG